MSSSDADAAWLGLVEARRYQITEVFGKRYKFPTKRTDIRQFRTALEALLKKYHHHYPAQREAELFPDCLRISDLAKSIDQSSPELKYVDPGSSLAALVWETLYALLTCALDAGCGVEPTISLLYELNQGFPNIPKSQQSRFPESKKVQQPLQTIFNILLDSYFHVYEEMKKTPPPKGSAPMSKQSLQEYINSIQQSYETARGIHGKRFSKEAEDFDRSEKEAQQPTLSAQRNLPSIMHKDMNRELEVSFISQKHLGNGSFGDVDEVQELTTGAIYARKHIHLDKEKPAEVIKEEVKNEVAIMQKLRHRHIASVLFYVKKADSYSIFMLPVADWDLRKYFDHCEEKEFEENLIKCINPWFGCLLDALAYAHKEEIKHQDIKPSNVLIKNNQPYLSDFGLAKSFEGMGDSSSQVVKRHGTPVYFAPEVVMGKKRGRSADIFSLGCVFTEMFTVTQKKSTKDYYKERNKGREPSKGSNQIHFRDCLPTVKTWMEQFGESRSTKSLLRAIKDMIEEDPLERPKAHFILKGLKGQRQFFCVESDV